MVALVGHHKLPNHLMLGPRVAVRKLLKQSAKLLGAVGEVGLNLEAFVPTATEMEVELLISKLNDR